MSEDPPTLQGHPHRWAVLRVMCGSLVLVMVSVSSLNVAIPPIQQALDASGSQLQWIIASYALVFAGLLLPADANRLWPVSRSLVSHPSAGCSPIRLFS